MNTRIVTSLPYTELEVADGNFDNTRSPIDRIIIHTMVGTWQGAAARFDNPASQVSAHYGIKLDGTYIHWLEETKTAYHAGNYPMNQRSIGIEHEDGWNGKAPEPTRPDILYSASAKLVHDICNFYNIPIDRQHILKHNEVSDKPTGCCDQLDIDRIVREASGAQIASVATDTIPVKKTDFEQLVSKASEYDKFVAGGYPHLDVVNTAINEKETALQNASKDLISCQTQVSTQLDQLNKLNDEDKSTTEQLLNAQHALQPYKDEENKFKTALGLSSDATENDILVALDTLKKSKVKTAPKPVTLLEKLKFIFS